MSSIQHEQPTSDHVAVYKKQARLMPDEDIHASIADYRWLLALAEVDDEHPADINENSRINARAALAGYQHELDWRASKGISKPVSTMGYDRDFLESLKARVRIEDQIGRTVALRPRSGRLVGLCPLHDDSTPSLTVYPDDGGWKCFGCQAGGDVLTWVQATTGLSFRESVHYLAGIASIEVPDARQSTSNRRRIRIGGR